MTKNLLAHFKYIIILLTLLLFSNAYQIVYAETFKHKINELTYTFPDTGKKIKFTPIKLSSKARELFSSRVRTTAADLKLPKAITLKMPNVPIFDQGEYLTCVTFATTAAIDALLDKGDYISQLCLLELGNKLHINSFKANPWEGLDSDDILKLIKDYGIINKENQAKGVCAGVLRYNPDAPSDDPAPNTLLTAKNYKKFSEDIFAKNHIIYHELFFSPKEEIQDDGVMIKTKGPLEDSLGRLVNGEQALTMVKDAIAKGRFVLIGTLVDFDGMPTQGLHLKANDTWFLTEAMKKKINDRTKEHVWGGHEILLYGYDDTAYAKTNADGTQKGLFLVRNSWGTERAPDAGIEFMTYDYFKALVADGIAIWKV